MKPLIILSSLASALGLAIMTLPAAAMPVPTQDGATVGRSDLVQDVRMRRRHRMRSMRRSSADSGNAAMPSRPPAARQYGNTSGGPRR